MTIRSVAAISCFDRMYCLNQVVSFRLHTLTEQEVLLDTSHGYLPDKEKDKSVFERYNQINISLVSVAVGLMRPNVFNRVSGGCVSFTFLIVSLVALLSAVIATLERSLRLYLGVLVYSHC